MAEKENKVQDTIQVHCYVTIKRPETEHEIEEYIKRAGSAMYATFGEHAEIFTAAATKVEEVKPEEEKKVVHLSLVPPA
jgi:hypothetical protein